LAAWVKLRCLATASKTRSVFSGGSDAESIMNSYKSY